MAGSVWGLNPVRPSPLGAVICRLAGRRGGLIGDAIASICGVSQTRTGARQESRGAKACRPYTGLLVWVTWSDAMEALDLHRPCPSIPGEHPRPSLSSLQVILAIHRRQDVYTVHKSEDSSTGQSTARPPPFFGTGNEPELTAA